MGLMIFRLVLVLTSLALAFDDVIVSGYYSFSKSKHSKSDYSVWITDLLKIIDCKFVFYSSPDIGKKYQEVYSKSDPKRKALLVNDEEDYKLIDESVTGVFITIYDSPDKFPVFSKF